MRKLLTALIMLISFSVSAQTLFYYGNDSVLVKDFLRAYQKNNTGARTEKAFREYLDLFIASRLKIREALERKYDTLPQLTSELDNLRQQIMPAYLNDKEGMTKLIDEAFLRSQKNIHIAHIFISSASDPQGKKSAAAIAEVKRSDADRNLAFTEIAKKYSDDPSVKINGGDLGWLAVFSLPYELENLAYSIPVGKSGVFQSKAGTHIFKNLGERRDPGRIKAAQILLAFPPEANEVTRSSLKKLADSLHNRIIKGDDFGKLATEFSNDVISAAANGQMQEFGVGQYDPVFEKQVYALATDGAVTKVFLTEHGYHIVKRLSKTPVVTIKDAKAIQTLQDKVEKSDRINSIRAVLTQKVLNAAYKKQNFSEAELWAFSDSILNAKPAGMPVRLNYPTVLFSIGNKTYMVADWMNYAQTFRYKTDGTGIKTYTQLWNEFLNNSAMDYYQANLEAFNEDFRSQVNEFREGNLFFEIMQQEIWNRGQTDNIGALEYFNRNKSKYNWKKSADAVIFYASDRASAKTFRDQLIKSPRSWNRLVNNFSEKITSDSARFELEQIPNPGRIILKPETVTALLINKADNTASFAYIIRNYDKPSPRTFDEAKGLVINDYQKELEKSWLAGLRKKYPVKINDKVLNELIRNKKY